MQWKSSLILPVAKLASAKLRRDTRNAIELQDRIMQKLVRRARHTQIGIELGFNQIRTHKDFAQQVPIRDYEGIRPYIDAITAGKRDVLWPGRPKYYAKSSGTTSGVKYLPITADSIPNHIGSARNALFNYVAIQNNASIFDGKLIFLSGSPVLEVKGRSKPLETPRSTKGASGESLSGGSPYRGTGGKDSTSKRFDGIPTGRLSGIVNHLIPNWLKGNQLPSYETNCIEDWEEKVDHIVRETLPADMRLISGIPPWVSMYYERLIEQSGIQTVSEIFRNYSLFVYGGVNYAPYASKLEALVGKPIDTLETYPASEGFIAFQDTWPFEGLRLNINSGIFFEFVPLDSIYTDNPDRITLRDVEPDKDYAVIINNNAGLWGYNIGDTVRFVSLDPYRVVVSGRVEHFISAFGEHVIAKEVDQAIHEACEMTQIKVVEFTVAPQASPPDGGAAYHEWFIEFDGTPSDLSVFASKLEESMIRQNIYYKDLIDGQILRHLVITQVKKDGFRKYMESQGKLGGQNKLPRLKNDRELVDML